MANSYENEGFFEYIFNTVFVEFVDRLAALVLGIIFGVLDPILPPAE